MLNSLFHSFFANYSVKDLIWMGIGFGGQSLFFMRFIIQWIHTERHRKSVIPEAFWYFSLVGGTIVAAYAFYLKNPVFFIGQLSGLVVYSRNLYFILREKKMRASDESLATSA